jgi:hypothetical protein
MAKPTTPFGHIAFGKDGSVTKHIEHLPKDKAGQEEAVGQKLLTRAGGKFFPEQQTSFKTLPERDNDFCILADGEPAATVECIELVERDYLAAPGVVTNHSIAQPDGTLRYIDTEKLANVLTDKIKLKLAKHYAKPKQGQFWLLIWSAGGLPALGHFWEGGQLKHSESTLRARQFLAKNGGGPFDKILYFGLQTNPTTVWPT